MKFAYFKINVHTVHSISNTVHKPLFFFFSSFKTVGRIASGTFPLCVCVSLSLLLNCSKRLFLFCPLFQITEGSPCLIAIKRIQHTCAQKHFSDTEGEKKLTKNRNLFTSCNVLLVGHMLQLFRCGERDSISKLAGLLPGPPVEENASFCLSVGTTHSHTETKHAHNNSPNLSQLYREKITALMSVVHTCNWCPEPPIIQTKH